MAPLAGLVIACLFAGACAETPPPSSPPASDKPSRPAVKGSAIPRVGIDAQEEEEALPLPEEAPKALSPFSKLLAPLRNAFAPITAAAGAEEVLEISSQDAADGDQAASLEQAPKRDWMMMIGMILLRLVLSLLPLFACREHAPD